MYTMGPGGIFKIHILWPNLKAVQIHVKLTTTHTLGAHLPLVMYI